jgi:hypothetical protein
MKTRYLLLPAMLLATVSCQSTLDVSPTDAVPTERAIVDAVSARAALRGAYDALQELSYYAEPMLSWGELSADNMSHSGTFTSYREADLNDLTTINTQVEATWDDIYEAINRANVVIDKVPSVSGLTDAEKNQIVGEARFLRALHYHNLVKYWGGVPIRTAPVASISEAGNVTRATVAEVYAQIMTDLQQAEALMTSLDETRAGSIGGVRALRARVMLYRESPGLTGLNTGDWAAVEAAASAVIDVMPYTLAAEYGDLFHPTGNSTSEDIFRLRFIAEDAFWAGYYYLVKSLGGRYEVAPTTSIRTAYEVGDERFTWSISSDPARPTRFYASKFPTPVGAEHPHVIRLAEVILIRAEARARQNNLVGAIDDYNLLRARAGLAAHALGVDVLTQADVIAAIGRERRVELAFEGDRWPDLVRTGQVVAVMNIADRPHQALYPIPQGEIDVTRNPDGSPRLTQNPGY